MDVETRIIGKSEYVGNEALQLGYEYTLRRLEISFLLKDNSDELMQDKLESEPNPIMQNLKRLLESALFGCQQGEFTQLKRVLREHGDYLIKESSRSLHDRKSGQMQVRVGRHLLKLEESMRSSGNPLYPLVPAWMDSRFNGSTI